MTESKLRKRYSRARREPYISVWRNGVKYIPVWSFIVHTPQDLGEKALINWIKGLKAQLKLTRELFKKYPRPNYRIFLNPVEGKGVDILVTKDVNGEYLDYMAIEVTNYSKDSYISKRDINRYIKNLTKFDYKKCQRILVVSYLSNLSHKKLGNWDTRLYRHHIKVWKRKEVKVSKEDLAKKIWRVYQAPKGQKELLKNA